MTDYVLNRETWIKDLKGPPISVLMTLLFFGGPDRGLNPTQIGRYTGYKWPAIYEALQDLANRGLCLNYGTQFAPAWIATTHAHQLALPMNGGQLADKSVILDYTCPNDVVDSNLEIVHIETTTTTYEGSVISDYTSLPEPVPDPDVKTRLLQLGVWPGRAQKAACDPWITLLRIDRWVKYLQAIGKIRNLPAVLMGHLENHEEPPDQLEAESGRRRYIEGKYADFIEH